jgi:fructokinase
MTPLVLCLGEILFDLLADQSDREVNQVTSWTSYPGGAPANVACASVKLGGRSASIGCLGDDPPGEALVQLLAAIGVNITGIQRHPSAPTRAVYVTRSLAGERFFAGFGETPTTDFADTRLAADRLPEILFPDAGFLVLGTLGLAYPHTRQAIDRAIELAKDNQVKVIIDINWRPVFWEDIRAAPPLILEMLQVADTIKCSDDEARWLFGTDCPQTIQQQLNPVAGTPPLNGGACGDRPAAVRGVLVTAGARGCQYCLGKNCGQVDSFQVDSVDTTGAGDAFLAGFLHQYIRQGEAIFENAEIAREAVIYGSAVGALTTMQPGAIAAQPTAQQVQAFLENLKISIF